MKTFNWTVLWILAMIMSLSLSSCDPMSSLECEIYNKTGDTVTVTLYKEIMISSFQGYTIVENDSVSTHYDADSCTRSARVMRI